MARMIALVAAGMQSAALPSRQFVNAKTLTTTVSLDRSGRSSAVTRS
jgi:hypothetical protein